MSEETEVTTNDAPTEDNIDTSSLLGETSVDAAIPEGQDEVVAQGELDHIPSKFMNEDGTPDYEKLANSYGELEKKIGSKVGVETIDEYEYDWGNGATPEDLAEDEVYQSAVQTMFDLGLSQDQFSGVMGEFEASVMDIIQEMTPPSQEESYASAKEELTDLWGDDINKNLTSAKTAWDTFAGDMDMSSVENNPIMLQVLAKIGSQLGEDTQVVKASPTPRMSQTEVEEIMNSDDYYVNDEKQAQAAAYFESLNK